MPEWRDSEVHDDENQAKADRKQQPGDRRHGTRTTTGGKTRGADETDQQPKLDQSPGAVVAELPGPRPGSSLQHLLCLSGRRRRIAAASNATKLNPWQRCAGSGTEHRDQIDFRNYRAA